MEAGETRPVEHGEDLAELYEIRRMPQEGHFQRKRPPTLGMVIDLPSFQVAK